MKNLFYFALVSLFITSCASTKMVKAPSPTGNWDYTITGTPEGDFNGVMTISEVDKALSAKLVSNGNELPIEKFMYNKETKKMSGELYYSGTPVMFDAVMNTDQMDGTMSAGGMNFPFKATRKK
ncbi:MAG: hypothetical protein JNJ65_09945 [Cyclobacteriaceae bacterium]|nr:hypothetical protein [Cyclobacteriaceae bacterium]